MAALAVGSFLVGGLVGGLTDHFAVKKCDKCDKCDKPTESPLTAALATGLQCAHYPT